MSMNPLLSPEKRHPKRKDCKWYVSGKCDLKYQIHGYGQSFNSRKNGWRWRCSDYTRDRPCEDYKKKGE